VMVKVAVGVEVGGAGGVAARDRNCNPPMTNNASTITPATRATIRPGKPRPAGAASGSDATGATGGSVKSAPQIRHVLARTETLAPQLGHVLGCVSERLGRFSMECTVYYVLRIASHAVRPYDLTPSNGRRNSRAYGYTVVRVQAWLLAFPFPLILPAG
jgi:hypothetical protein